jgi:IS5 family transposase
VILKMLVVKRLYGYSYEETERQVSNSLRLRQFCRVYLNTIPDDTTQIRWDNLIQPKTLEKFNARITQMAIERKATCGWKMRTDAIVVDSNIRRLVMDVCCRLKDVIILEAATDGNHIGFHCQRHITPARSTIHLGHPVRVKDRFCTN